MKNLDRILPNSRDAEMAVLGAMLLDPERAGLLATQKVQEQQFYYASHQVIFRHLCYLLSTSDVAVDAVLLRTRLSDRGLLEEVGGWAFLADLVSHVPTTENVQHYIDIVKKKEVLRRAIEAAYTLTERSFESEDEPPAIISQTIHELTSLCETGGDGPVKSSVLTPRVMQHLQERWASGREFDGLSTGIAELDALIWGMKPAEVVIIAAYPGEGKSCLANCIADNVADAGTNVLYHNLEMLGEEQTERSIAAGASVDLSRYHPNTNHEQAMEDIIASARRSENRPKWVSDGAGRTVAQIAAESRRFQARYGCGLVVLDFLQELPWPVGADNENAAITQNMTTVKSAAMAMRCPWIVLSQFSLDAAKTKRRPRLHDLRGSGSIGQSAHKALLLSRLGEDDRELLPDGLQHIDDSILNELTLVDAVKARGGRTGEAVLRFRRQFTRFDGIADLRRTNESPGGREE